MSEPSQDRWFREEVLPHEAALRGWLCAQFPALADVDDLVQETYVRILRASQKTAIAVPRAFLFATARHLALDQLRRRQVVAFDPVTEWDERTVYDDGPSAADAAARHQELELLALAIQSLPPRCREVLMLRKIHGMSQKEIAAHMGISENTVEVQIGKGVQRCAEFLARHGLP